MSNETGVTTLKPQVQLITSPGSNPVGLKQQINTLQQPHFGALRGLMAQLILA